MPDDLRTRIAAVQAQHHHWDYAGALECACGETFRLGVEAGWDAAVAGWAVHVADAVIRELGLADTVRLLRAAQVWIADAISEDPSGEPWLMARTLLNQLVSRVDFMGGWADE